MAGYRLPAVAIMLSPMRAWRHPRFIRTAALAMGLALASMQAELAIAETHQEGARIEAATAVSLGAVGAPSGDGPQSPAPNLPAHSLHMCHCLHAHGELRAAGPALRISERTATVALTDAAGSPTGTLLVPPTPPPIA